MPQAPTANLALIRPTELGDSGVWASLLDTMFAVIDVHDHTPGKGVLIPMASGVSIAADIPWNSGGTFYAITGLKAIDFQPQPIASMSTFAGALFVNSANNELSYRTTGGAIVQFTNGGAFNFAAIGAIGGDYTSAGALVQYIDASDLYQFLQQVGGGVRQYARLDCGGVDFFEYKAQPAVGVPSNRIRLASPAALAAAYDLTLPGALPAALRPVLIDAAGLISTLGTAFTFPVPPATTKPLYMDSAGAVTTVRAETITYAATLGTPTSGSAAIIDSSGLQIALVTAGALAVALPLPLPVGAVITGWTVYFNKTQVGTISASVLEVNMTANTTAAVGTTKSNAAASPGFVTLSETGLSFTVVAGRSYVILVSGSGNSGDLIRGYSITLG